MLDAKTIGGKRLLQICIDNEREYNEDHFGLEELMKMLLEQKLCNPNVMDFNGKETLLTYAYTHKKHNAFKLLLMYSDVDPNIKNADGSTTYGVLFYHNLSEYYDTEGFKPKESMELLLTYRKNINYHFQ